jgi:hypothetical protein
MLTFRVQATGALLTDPNVLERFDTEVQATLAELGAYGQRLVVQGAPRGVSAGGGGLRGSIFTELRGVPARRQAIVASSVFYAPIVEAGRRPGRRPPLGPIKLWVARKLSVPTSQVARVAFLVARKIGRGGTEGAHMFDRAAKALEPVAANRFQALAERIGRVLRGD